MMPQIGGRFPTGEGVVAGCGAAGSGGGGGDAGLSTALRSGRDDTSVEGVGQVSDVGWGLRLGPVVPGLLRVTAKTGVSADW